MNFQIDWASADSAILIIMALSGLFGMVRGITKEILGLLSWIGSAVLTILLFPYAKNVAAAHIQHGLIADFVTASALFVLFLTILGIFNYMCSDFIKKSVLSKPDKFLGILFGLVRGIVVIACLNLAISQWIISETFSPKWPENSKLIKHVEKFANFLILMLPNHMQDTLVSHMSGLNKEKLLAFIMENTESLDDNNNHTTTKKSTELSRAEAIPVDNNISSNDESTEAVIVDESEKIESSSRGKQREAEQLATLNPKTNVEKNQRVIIPKKTNKEKLDMNRFMDLEPMYDDER
jgi:membrane protein required for colicin V production